MPALTRRLGLFTLAFLAFTAISCSYASEADLGFFAQLELDASYAEPFSYLSGIREMPDGRILAADPLGQVPLSIDLESGVADTTGGAGGGPEEYEQPDRVFALPGDSTLLVDLGNSRLTVIDPGMAFVETLPLARPTESGSMLLLLPRYVDAQGRIYFQGMSMMGRGAAMPDSAYIARYDRGTEVVDTMGMVKLPESERSSAGGGNIRLGPRPMTPQDEWAVGPDGTAAVVRAADYSVDYYRPDGTFVDGPPNTVEPLSVGQAEKEEWVNGKGADGLAVMMSRSTSGVTSMQFSRGGMGFDSGGDDPTVDDYEFPDVLPVFRQGRVRVSPEGNTWVERWMQADSPPTFEIFDTFGNWAGTVQLPEGRRLIGFGDGTIYVIRIDEVDLKWLERYRIVRSVG
jgi:hypothetical protein